MSIITIDRGIKSGGLEISNQLSKMMGYKTLSEEDVIAESARKFNIMGDILQAKLEKTPNLLQKFTNEYGQYIIFIQCALLNAVKEDNIIYHGNAGHLLLKPLPNVLKLRIDAPLEYRIRSVIKEFNYTYDQASDFITKADEQRRRWVKLIYGEDWYNPSLYDLCINLQNMSMDNICKIVAMTVDHKDFKSSENSEKQLKDLILECEVKAALACDGQLLDQQIAVSASDGSITLRGMAKNEENRRLIIDTTQKVKGVKKCTSEINLMSDPLH